MAKSLPSIADLLADAGAELTPTERRIAQLVLAEPTLIAFGTVSDLAARVKTSRPSIVRFANKLGFEGYTELQRHVRSDVSRQLARPSDRIRQEGRASSSASSAREAIDTAIDSVFNARQGDQLQAIVKLILKAKRVWILSGETSRAGAHAFHSGLSMVRPGVHLLEQHTLGSDLSDSGKGDVAVVFDFFRYRRIVVEITQVLADNEVEIAAITDGPLSPLVELTDTWCEISVPAIGPFDSSVPVVAIAELLVANVTKALQGKAKTRIDRIETLWDEADVFL